MHVVFINWLEERKIMLEQKAQLEKDLREAKQDMAFYREEFRLYNTEEDFEKAVDAYNKVERIQSKIIALLWENNAL